MVDTRVASSYVQLLQEYLVRQGLDPLRVLGEAPEPEAHFVPMATWQRWLARVDALEQRPGLGLRIAEGIGPRHFGVVGHAALACATLGEALQRLERFHASVYDANPAQVQLGPQGVTVEWGVARGRPGALVDAWRRTLVPLIREGRTGLAALAEAHHTSVRSLQRRLAEQGTSFQQMLDDTRRHLAEGHLKNARLDVAEIALLLGYSEQSAFTRAFRSWTGVTPALWRRQHLLDAA